MAIQGDFVDDYLAIQTTMMLEWVDCFSATRVGDRRLHDAAWDTVLRGEVVVLGPGTPLGVLLGVVWGLH